MIEQIVRGFSGDLNFVTDQAKDLAYRNRGGDGRGRLSAMDFARFICDETRDRVDFNERDLEDMLTQYFVDNYTKEVDMKRFEKRFEDIRYNRAIANGRHQRSAGGGRHGRPDDRRPPDDRNDPYLPYGEWLRRTGYADDLRSQTDYQKLRDKRDP